MNSHQKILRTKRLLLRAVKQDDLFDLNRLLRDEASMKYWSSGPHSLADTIGFIDQMLSSGFNGVLDFVICLLPESGEGDDTPDVIGKGDETGGETIDTIFLTVVGTAGIWDAKEIGFILNRDYWGKGYAHEALTAVIQNFWEWAPEKPIVGENSPASQSVIKADVDPRNDSCLKLLKKLGFEVVGSAEKTYETHIGWCDSVYLECKRPQPR